jgi:hypothetical protein
MALPGAPRSRAPAPARRPREWWKSGQCSEGARRVLTCRPGCPEQERRSRPDGPGAQRHTARPHPAPSHAAGRGCPVAYRALGLWASGRGASTPPRHASASSFLALRRLVPFEGHSGVPFSLPRCTDSLQRLWGSGTGVPPAAGKSTGGAERGRARRRQGPQLARPDGQRGRRRRPLPE